MSSQTSEMGKIIDEAAEKSAVTCERCGASGKLDADGFWIQVLCDGCREDKPK